MTMVLEPSPNKVGNTQVDYARTVTIEFDSNSRGPFTFKSVKTFLEVHPGEMIEIVYEVTNNLNRKLFRGMRLSVQQSFLRH